MPSAAIAALLFFLSNVDDEDTPMKIGMLGTSTKLVLADLGGRGASEMVAELAPGARVVKAFNNILMTNFNAGPVRDQARRVLFVSGDDKDAKAFVTDFINGMGFRTIDL